MSKPRFFQRNGTEIEWFEYVFLWRSAEYCRVAYTVLKNGMEISTVWIGSNYGEEDEPPLIFETMAFSKDGTTFDKRRYSTETEAVTGHDSTVRKWTAHLN